MRYTVNLSDREEAVLAGIVADKTYSQIAHEMNVGYETVKTYAKRLRAKLGKSSKVGLALWASKRRRATKGTILCGR